MSPQSEQSRALERLSRMLSEVFWVEARAFKRGPHYPLILRVMG